MSEPTLPSGQQNPFDALKKGDATLRMLLVGIDGYRNLSSLNFAVADCQGLTAALLESSKGFPSKVSVSIVGDREILSPVTLDSVEKAFEQLLAGVQPQDTVLIYFSGHGDLDESTEELYLCLTETRQALLSETALSVKQLLQRLKDSGASSQVLILDTCHSGGVISSSRKGLEVSDTGGSPRSIEREDNPQFTPRLTEILNQQAFPSREFCALLSCQATQLSWEFADLGHGAFTYYLMEGLQTSAETADRLGRIDVESLYDYVRHHTEELVLKRHGKQQTPSRIVSGSHKIFLGARNNNRSLEERRNCYKKIVRNLLRKSYQPDCPITEEVANQLEYFADQESAPPQSKLEIESNEIRDLEDELDHYQTRVSKWLHQNYPQDPETFCSERRTSVGFSLRITEPFDACARQEFSDHQYEYQERFRKFLYKELENHDRVRIYGLDFGFSESVLSYLEERINEEFIQDQLVYSTEVRRIFRRQLEVNKQQIQTLQEEKGFCDRISQKILNQELQLLEKDKEIYRQDVRHLFHEQNKPNLDSLKGLQEDLDLGDKIVEEVREKEEKYLNQNRERYRQQYANCLREYEELSTDTLDHLKKLSIALGFTSPTRGIIEMIEWEEKKSCQQSLAAYRQILTEIILQEGPLNLEGNNQLEKAEMRSQLGGAWIKACRSEVIAEFNDGEKIYAREYAGKIRKSNSLTHTDRLLLGDKQIELDLGDLVIKTIESREDSNLSRDKEQYQRSFRNEIRQRSIASDINQNLKQKQIDLKLGDEIIYAIECSENKALAKDILRYQETVVNELTREYPLSVISQRNLKKKQDELELSDELARKIEKTETDKSQAQRTAQNEYETEFSCTIRRYNLLAEESLSKEDRTELDEYCRRHNLDIQYTQQIEHHFINAYKKRLQDYHSAYQEELGKDAIDRKMLDRLIEDGVLVIDRKVAKSIETDIEQRQKLKWSLPSWQRSVLSITPLLLPIQTTLHRSRDYVEGQVVGRSRQLKMGAFYLLGFGAVVSGGTIAFKHLKANQPTETIALPMESFPLPFRSKFPQELLNYSIADVLSNAKSNYSKGDFERAIVALKSIPEGSKKYGESQITLKKWEKEWSTDKAAFEKAKAAKKISQWETVKIEGGKINHPFWKGHITPLLEEAEKMSRPSPKMDEPLPSSSDSAEPNLTPAQQHPPENPDREVPGWEPVRTYPPSNPPTDSGPKAPPNQSGERKEPV